MVIKLATPEQTTQALAEFKTATHLMVSCDDCSWGLGTLVNIPIEDVFSMVYQEEETESRYEDIVYVEFKHTETEGETEVLPILDYQFLKLQPFND